MACFADINVSQGSVATQARCGGTFNIHLTAKFTKEPCSEKNCVNRLRFDRVIVMSLWPRFLAHPVYTVSQKTRHQALAHNFTKYYPISKFFTDGLSSKFAASSCLNIPPTLKHVATLPYEI